MGQNGNDDEKAGEKEGKPNERGRLTLIPSTASSDRAHALRSLIVAR